MRRRANALLFVVALMLVTADSAAQVSMGFGMRDTPPNKEQERPARKGTSRVRGRVTAADTGSVVRRAQVVLSSSEDGAKTAATDAQGRYEFRDLPAGRFTLRVAKSGFLDTRYGQTHPAKRGRTIELGEGQVLDKIDVALARGGAISGRILDEFGDPVSDATVTAMRAHLAGGQRRLVSTGRTSTTSDLGTFRLFGLPPGEYYVSANTRNADLLMGLTDPAAAASAGANSTGHAATYYPNTANPAEAQRITLSIGQEVSADVQMFPVRLARISGTAVASDGKPIAPGMVMLIPATMEEMSLGGGTETDKDGKFVLTGVAPGEYTVQVQSIAALMSAATQAMAVFSGEGKNAPPPTVNREFATAKVTVAGEDIAGLTIVATRGARARGRIVFEHGQPPDDLTSLRLVAQMRGVNNVHMEMPPAMSLVKENGTFEMDGLAGAQTFEFMDPPKGWFLKRITHDGTDITDKGYDFTPAEDTGGFEIVMTTRSQTVTGSVSNDKGETLKEYKVIVFPDDPEQWTGATTRSFGTAEPDGQGQFQVSGLPAGSYFAIAIDADDEVEWTEPDWLERAAKTATRFTLDEGATKRLELKLSGS